MIINGIRTIYNVKLQNTYMFNLDYVPDTGSTLNEKFNIDVTSKTNDRPYINHIVIGSRFSNNYDIRTELELELSKHSSADAALFNHVPFFMVKVDEIESVKVNPNYCLKTMEVIDGVQYYVYYGYKLTNVYMDTYLKQQTVNDYSKLSTINDFIPGEHDVLNPVPKVYDVTNTNMYIKNDVVITNYLSTDVINNIKEAIYLKFGSNANYVIDEVGICSGIPVESESSTEFAVSQINYILDVYYDLSKIDRLDMKISIGGLELLKL